MSDPLQEWGAARALRAPSPAEAQELVARARRRRWVRRVGPVCVLALAVALLWVGLRPGKEVGTAPEPPAVAEVAPAGPEVLADGTHHLDGDVLEVEGVVEVLGGRLALTRGRVTVTAHPRAEAPLEVVAGSWSVRVVGTVFTVVRDPFEVAVAEGIVEVVRGEDQWRLGAGQRFADGRVVRPRPAPPAVPELAELRAQVLRGEVEGARAGLARRLDVHPDDHEAWALLAQVHTREGHRDEALVAWSRVVDLGGRPAQRARYESAVLLEDRPAEAVPLLRAFLETPDPLAAEARLRLGQALLDLGDASGARAELEAVAAEHPGTRPASKAAQILADLEP